MKNNESVRLGQRGFLMEPNARKKGDRRPGGESELWQSPSSQVSRKLGAPRRHDSSPISVRRISSSRKRMGAGDGLGRKVCPPPRHARRERLPITGGSLRCGENSGKANGKEGVCFYASQLRSKRRISRPLGGGDPGRLLLSAGSTLQLAYVLGPRDR